MKCNRYIKTFFQILHPGSKHFFLGWVVLLFALLNSCSPGKHLQDDQWLYKGHSIDVTDKSGVEALGVKGSLKEHIQPKPNARLFGLFPMRLWFYYLAGDSVPEKGFRHWMKTKLGQPPVVYESYFASNAENTLLDYLYSKGYFDAEVKSNTQTSGKTARLDYKVTLKNQYTLDSIVFPDTTNEIYSIINNFRSLSELKQGQKYDLEMLDKERGKISHYLRNRGYYYFSPNNLIYEVDTNQAENNAKLYIKLKEGIQARATQKYRINSILIESDFSLRKLKVAKDTVQLDTNYFFIAESGSVKPSIIKNAITMEPGNYFSANTYNITLNKLTGLGIYKYTNIDFKQASTDTNLLDVKIYLTPSVPKSVRAELQAVTKSNDYTGPELALSYNDKNFLHGAERFSLNLNTSYETQLGGENENGNAYQFGVESNLSIPRFVFPFSGLNKYLSRKYTPRSTFKAGYNYYFRTRYFRINNFDLIRGYNWRQSSTITHDLRLLNISYSRLSGITDEFQRILNENELVRQSFAEELIFSMSYKYLYNNQLTDRKFSSYLSINPELAGNTLSLYNWVVEGRFPSNEQPAHALGIKYAQYARLVLDMRSYLQVSKESKLVGRLLTGVGKAFGNSTVLPFSKRFYVGGVSDLRAFRSHTVGPGSYAPADTSSSNSYFQRVGNVKIEANLEYRFRIYKLVKGAIFLDAGNVWLLEGTESLEEGRFSWEELVPELAVGTGFGIRLDASVFVLRLDLGIPLRKPWYPKGERWISNEIDFSDSNWRNKNLVLNIAIGYPF